MYIIFAGCAGGETVREMSTAIASAPGTDRVPLNESLRPKPNLERFVWSHQSITGVISQRQFAPQG